MRYLLGVCVFLLCCWSTASFARDIHVDGTKGNDGNGGTIASPLATIQKGLSMAQAGDVVVVQDGTYTESLSTTRDGTAAQRITLRAAARGKAIVTNKGRVFDLNHGYFTIDGLIVDGQYAAADTVRVRGGANFLIIRHTEVRHSARDCIDIDSGAPPQDILIEDAKIHHCLWWDKARVDAHAITGGTNGLTIRRSEIYQFSGDGVQIDPGRQTWKGTVTIEDSTIWNAPFAQPTAGFPAGKAPGENAFDSKWRGTTPGKVIVRRSTFYGFDKGYITNMAALNLKEHIDAEVDACRFYDNEIALRIRSGYKGKFKISNSVFYRNQFAVRYEDFNGTTDQDLQVYNCTFGLGNGQTFRAASSSPDLNAGALNCLFVDAIPASLKDPSNLRTPETDFQDAATGDYQLRPNATAIDKGKTIKTVTTDFNGTKRPQGKAHDVGAFEWKAGIPPAEKPMPPTEPTNEPIPPTEPPQEQSGQEQAPTEPPIGSDQSTTPELPGTSEKVTDTGNPDSGAAFDASTNDLTTPQDPTSGQDQQGASELGSTPKSGCGCSQEDLSGSWWMLVGLLLLGLCIRRI